MKTFTLLLSFITCLTLITGTVCNCFAQKQKKKVDTILHIDTLQKEGKQPNRDTKSLQKALLKDTLGTELHPLVIQVKDKGIDVQKLLEILIPALIAVASALGAIYVEARIRANETWRTKSAATSGLVLGLTEPVSEYFIIRRVQTLTKAAELLLDPKDQNTAFLRMQLEEWHEEWKLWKQQLGEVLKALGEIAVIALNKKEADVSIHLRTLLGELYSGIERALNARYFKETFKIEYDERGSATDSSIQRRDEIDTKWNDAFQTIRDIKKEIAIAINEFNKTNWLNNKSA